MMHDARQKSMGAVRTLRTALGLNQTEFGRRLEKSLPTIQRWETIRPPRGSALAALHRMARTAGQKELADLFWKAIHDELGVSDDAGRKINDAVADVVRAATRIRMLGGNLTPTQQHEIEDIAARLDAVYSTLSQFDPYSLVAIEGGESE